jgi:hypothetical protein
VVQGRLTVLAWGSDPLEPPRGAAGAWPASRQAPARVLAWGSDPPWNPPGRRWRLAGKPAGPSARARHTGQGAGEGSPGGGPDWTAKDVLSWCPAAPVTTTLWWPRGIGPG